MHVSGACRVKQDRTSWFIGTSRVLVNFSNKDYETLQ